ncbi:MAG: Ig-like domain-containing protein [Caldimonas sp.]
MLPSARGLSARGPRRCRPRKRIAHLSDTHRGTVRQAGHRHPHRRGPRRDLRSDRGPAMGIDGGQSARPGEVQAWLVKIGAIRAAGMPASALGSRWRCWGQGLCLGASLLAIGCGGDVGPGRVEISPAEARLAVGSNLALSASVFGASGAPRTGAPVTWTSSSPGVATVASDGTALGVAPGVAEIKASSGDASNVATVTVAPAVLANVFAVSRVLAPGSSEPFSAQVLDATNQVLVASLAWTSSDPTVASVAADGRVVANAPGTAAVSVTTPGAGAATTVAVQAPLSGHIAFVSQREPLWGTPVAMPNGGVYLMRTDGSGVQLQVADTHQACNPDFPGSAERCPFPVNQPALAGDGLRLAVVSLELWEIEFRDTVINICATGTALCQRLDYPQQTRPPGPVVTLHGVAAPAWSPDGSKLAFAGGGPIWVWSLATSTYAQFASGAGWASEPGWSPYGSRIAFVAGGAIWLANADGSGQLRLSAAGSDDSHPSWSPDGRRIAFARNLGTNSEIFVMNADGTGATNVTNDPAQDRNPAWSPDGRRIAFDTDRDGNREIYLMDPDGANLLNLTHNPAPDYSPSWSP